MFQGAIPTELRQIIHEQANAWAVDDVYVGCSGNFTIERTLDNGRFAFHGNDVSIYSCALGLIQAGGEWPIRVKDEHRDEWGWLEDWGATPVDQAATVLLCSAMLQGLGRDNAYYDRLRGAYRDDWAHLHSVTRGKFTEQRVPLASFHAGDVRDFLRAAPRAAAFASFPPFYANGYETMFKGLSEVLAWDEPSYETFDPSGIADVLGMAREFEHWLIGTNQRVPELEDSLRGYVQVTNRAMPFWVYASGPKPRLVTPHQVVSSPPVPHLHRDAEIGSTLSLAPLTDGQLNALRSVYLNPRIKPAQAALALAVLVDGYLVGCFAFAQPSSTKPMSGVPHPAMYLLSDFAISPTRYRRLSKLVLHAAVSRESVGLAERFTNRRIRSVVTTAFTDRPASMKYRGTLNLLKRTDRGEDRDRAEFPSRFELNYGIDAPRWTLAEGLEVWRQKHSEVKEPAGA